MSGAREHATLRERHCLGGHTGAVQSVRFTADGAYVLSAGADRSVRLWNPRRGRLVKTYAAEHSRGLRDAAAAPGNASFASCGGGRQVLLRDVETGTVARRLGGRRGHEHAVNAVCFAAGTGAGTGAGAALLLSASDDRTVRAWDLRSRSPDPVQVFPPAGDAATAVAYSPADGAVLCASLDGTVRTFEPRTGRALADRLGAAATSLALPADGGSALAACLGGRVLLLDRRDGRVLRALGGAHAHDSYPLRCASARNGAWAVAASEDGLVVVYDAEGGGVAARLRGHERAVMAVDAHPLHEPFLVSAGADGTVRCWW